MIQGLENKSSQSRLKESCLSDISSSADYRHTQGENLQNNKKFFSLVDKDFTRLVF